MIKLSKYSHNKYDGDINKIKTVYTETGCQKFLTFGSDD